MMRLISLIASIFFAAAFLAYPESPNLAVITMPLEITTTSGEVSVSVNVSDATDVNRLWLECHQCAFHWGSQGIIQVQINAEGWQDIDNATFTCEDVDIGMPGLQERACLGGDYHTVSGWMPVTGMVTGANTVAFRRNPAKTSKETLNFGGAGSVTLEIGVRSVSRIVGLDLRTSGDVSRVTDTFTLRAFTDPEYEIPAGYDVPDSISSGETLWRSNDLLLEADYAGASVIVAACADCHNDDGYDLRYFGYTGSTIINRSQFHGLTETQGKKIAAFIFSSHTFTPQSRPWYPTYQPGNCTDDGDVNGWAAGCFNEVLRDDRDSQDELFPNGMRDWQRYRTTETLNVRKIPEALLFPDWNNWLPDIHPFDAYGKTAFQAGAGGSKRPWSFYQDLIADAEGLPATSEDFMSDMFQLAKKAHEWKFDTPVSIEAQGFPYKNIVWMGLSQWAAVKSFEIMHGVGHSKGNLQGRSVDWFHPATATLPAGEALTWPGRGKPFFSIAPHICCSDQFADQGPWETDAKNKFFSTLWYELQMVVQAGNRRITSNNPMDWKYHFGHNGNDCEFSGTRQSFRSMKAQIKMMQMLDNDTGVGPGSSGWYLRHVDIPKWKSPRIQKCINDGMTGTQERDFAEGMTRAFNEKTMSHDISEWTRGYSSSSGELIPADYTPSILTSWPNASEHADAIYMYTDYLANLGVDLSVVDSLATWGEIAWPLGNWEQWHFCSQPTPPEDCAGDPPGVVPTVVTLTAPNGTETYQRDELVSVTWTSDAFTGTVVLELMDGATVVDTLAGGTLNDGAYDWTVAQADGANYTIRLTHPSEALSDVSDGVFTISGALSPGFEQQNLNWFAHRSWGPGGFVPDGADSLYAEGSLDRKPTEQTFTVLRSCPVPCTYRWRISGIRGPSPLSHGAFILMAADDSTANAVRVEATRSGRARLSYRIGANTLYETSTSTIVGEDVCFEAVYDGDDVAVTYQPTCIGAYQSLGSVVITLTDPVQVGFLVDSRGPGQASVHIPNIERGL